MADAIIYVSNTGFTKKYASLLSNETGLPCYSLGEALTALKKGYQVIFLGWLRAGKIVGLNKAQSSFDIVAVAGVGMRKQNAEALADLIKQNNLGKLPAFYLRGGMDTQKMDSLNRLMLQFAAKVMSKTAAAKKDPEAAESFDMLKNGGDFVSPENLRELIAWCRAN